MRIGRKIDIDLTMQSFKRYLRSVLFQEKTDIESIKWSCSLAPYEYDRYADAFYIVSKNGEFELTLTPNEYRAIRYFHYHNPIDAKPSDYDISFANAFKKWCAVFFPNQGRQFVDIDPKTLGAMMRRSGLGRGGRRRRWGRSWASTGRQSGSMKMGEERHPSTTFTVSASISISPWMS